MTDRNRPLAVPLTNRDHVLGPPTAMISVVEYGDFECPSCRRVYPIIKRLRQQLGNRLQFAFRHFPVHDQHPHANHAAEAAEAAAAQGRFWDMHDLLFEHQYALDDASLRAYSVQLGLDVARFVSELQLDVYRQRLLDDFWGGLRSGLRTTPTFFVDGVGYGEGFGGGLSPEELFLALNWCDTYGGGTTFAAESTDTVAELVADALVERTTEGELFRLSSNSAPPIAIQGPARSSSGMTLREVSQAS